MSAGVQEWTEQSKDDWYEANDRHPATHVITGSLDFRVPIVIPPWHEGEDIADSVAAELVAAWQLEIEDGALGWDYTDVDHPAHDTLSAPERATSPGAVFRITKAKS